MFSLLPLKVLYFPHWVEVSLDSESEHIFSATTKKILNIFRSILSRIDECNLFLSTNVLLFNVLTILIYHFVLFFSVLSQAA